MGGLALRGEQGILWIPVADMLSCSGTVSSLAAGKQ